MSEHTPGLDTIDLGRMAYEQALAIQRARQAELIEARGDPAGDLGTIYLVEHPPIITVTRRKGAASHVLADADRLAALGVQLHQTDRGGDVTYHGPGQIVAYPILDLERLTNTDTGKPLGLHGYMRLLEQAVIDTLDTYGIQGDRDPEATGVWVKPANGPPAKIAAMGVRVRKWITTHGLALNVDPDLTHFSLIVPCGLHERSVTSMRAVLGDACPSFRATQAALVTNLARLVQIARADQPIFR
ncbi:MAG: lipoyl(octanoyl) transferase LipB [Phycisphaera sp.]|nr:MAG: lipoyl(octanoyl) transferase LipB [Phycisphaera sp.]